MSKEEDFSKTTDHELPISNIRVAIVGSREFKDYELLKSTMIGFAKDYGKPTSVVSGGARGADKLGEKWARENKIDLTLFKPDWSTGKHAGLDRNHDIVREATHVVAFPSKNSRGTFHTIKLAKQRKLPVLEIRWD